MPMELTHFPVRPMSIAAARGNQDDGCVWGCLGVSGCVWVGCGVDKDRKEGGDNGKHARGRKRRMMKQTANKCRLGVLSRMREITSMPVYNRFATEMIARRSHF